MIAFADSQPTNVSMEMGTGNREIKISDYDEITFVGSADFEYEQSDKAPYLSVTIDENLLITS